MTRATPDDELTLQQAADALGVHYMTAYRYVRTGRLPAARYGSHWRVRRADLTELAPTAAAGRAAGSTTKSRLHYERRLTNRLVRGDEAEAWRVTQDALGAACDPEDLYLDVLGPALRRVGDEWQAGRLTVADEHRASALMYRLVGRLGPLLTHRGRTRGLVVLGAAAGDQHGLATALVADVLRGRGFSVADLGANTPPASFVDAVNGADRLVAIGIVASTPADAAVGTTIAALRGATASPVLLGGVGIRDGAHAAQLGADGYSASARAAVDWFSVHGGR